MIGVSSPSFSLRSFEEILDSIEPHFDLWEIVSEADHFLPDIHKTLREAMETTSMKFQIHAPFSDINLAAFDERTRNYSIGVIMEIMELANDLGIDVVTVHPGKLGPIQWYGKDRVPKLTRESLEILSKGCAEFTTVLALENMPAMKYTICHKASELQEMVNGLDIEMCFDVGHANICRQIPEFLDMKDKFSNIHLSDNVGDKDKHMPPGAGNIDFKMIMDGLVGYKGNFIIESRSLEDAILGRDHLLSL